MSGAGDAGSDAGIPTDANGSLAQLPSDVLSIQLDQMGDSNGQCVADGSSTAEDAIASVDGDHTAAHAAIDAFFAQLESNATASSLLTIA